MPGSMQWLHWSSGLLTGATLGVGSASVAEIRLGNHPRREALVLSIPLQHLDRDSKVPISPPASPLGWGLNMQLNGRDLTTVTKTPSLSSHPIRLTVCLQ